MKLYAEERVQKRVKQDFDYAFSEHPYPAFRKSTCIRFAPTSLSPSDRRGSSRSRGHHYKLPVLGFRIGPLAYLTDMNRIDEREIDKIRGVDTLVINALRKEPHLSHFTLDRCAADQPRRLF